MDLQIDGNGSTIKAVIFDLGNVLIDFDHAIAAQRISRFTAKTIQEIYSLFFNSGITQLFEEGRIAPAEFFLKVQQMLDLTLDFNSFLPIWNEIFFLTEKNKAVHRLAEELRKGYALAVLSNVNILHMEYIRGHFPIFGAFSHVFTSYELGGIKPDPAVYNKALATLGVLPSQAFYTDDREDLIEKASELGIVSFVYKGPDKLKNDLLSVGIEVK
jgi:glucose-1-phosphatase